jgi:hypothetical protein
MSEHEHCWHTGSEADSARYSSDGSGVTVTHLMCCHCGEIKVERREWKASAPPPDRKQHGSHNWNEARSNFQVMIQ